MSALNLKILDDKLEQEKDYWIQKLSGNLINASLPADFRRSDSNGHERGFAQFQTDVQTQTRLRSICGNSESLIFAALVAALKLCLHKYTGHEDIIVGTTIHERYRETASFNKILALRTRVSGAMTAKQLLLAVKDTLSEAYTHQKYPFEKLLEHLHDNHQLNGSPLFRVAVTLDNINRREHLEPLRNDLTLRFSLEGDELKGTIEYARQLFKKGTIDLFAKHYQEILRILVNSPEIEIARLELLSDSEKHQLIFDYNQTERDYPKHKAIHQLFEEQVERTPDTTAATFSQEHLTYRELNQRANQLAHYLQRIGVEPGDRVGIYLEHSLETLIAILGILKAGAAYVPVDPDHPVARLLFMLEDAHISVLLTQSSLVERMPAADTTLLCLDSEWEKVASERSQNPPSKATAEDLAYVIYTSGSTGIPKGVKIQHRALVNYIWWAKDTYLQDEKLDFALYSSLAFDLTVTSVFTPLLTGNRVVVYRPDQWQSPLAEILKDDQVGVLKLTPSHLSLIKDADNSQSHIKRLIVGGEAFESELARQVYESFGRQVEIFNEYGPTEATVGCMIHRFDPAQVDLVSVPIGRPAANVQIYILDEQLLPVPENVIGELYISGDGLAEGYLNRDDLTADKFINNPFIAGQQMYRSGDLARWLPNHEIEYVGRKDEQIKIRGYRVELNELRTALNRYPGIRDSVVVLRKKAGHGNDLMIAYYAARQEIESRLLRDFMSERIIKETVPNFFVHLKKLPLTLNGKINIEALPDVEESRAQAKSLYLAPRTPVEAALVSIWEETLGFKQVGVDDNFFELGGHSLLATQLMSHVREVFQVELQLRSLFAEPTVKALAKKIEEQMKPERRLPEPPIVPVSRAQSLPLSFAQQRLWFFDQLEPGSSFYNVPLAIRLKGTLNIPVLEQTLNEIIRRHESLRTTFATIDRQPVQIIGSPSPLRLHLQDLSHLAEKDRESEAQRLAQEEAQEPFDLEQGPLLRVKLLRLGESEHVVLLTMHHVVSDGWSFGPLLREVATLYNVYSRGESPTLAELPIQYADFAVWQRNWLQGEVLEERLEYWRQHLAGAPPFLELPFSRPQPSDQIAPRGERIPITLDAHLTESLRALSRREGVTLFMTLLAAWQALLARYSNQDHIVVGTAIANRNRAETEGLIGFFVNTLALHTDLSGDPSFRQLLERVKDVCLGAYSHQDVPFEKVVEDLQPERSVSHTPLFQVMFVMQNAPLEAPQLQGLTLNLMDRDSGTAQFVLLLDLQETGNGISGALRYNTDLFEKSMIEHMVGHFQSLLESVVADAEQSLSVLTLLAPDERRQILDQCHGETISRPVACLHELFERQVNETPDSIAVKFEAEHLTYRELNERANQLAHHLRVLGVGTEVRVGICLERSLELMVGLLGILKAGGAYVPLDPAYPQERLAFMLEDAQVHVLLTQERLLKLFGEGMIKSVCLDRDWETIAQCGTENLCSGADGQNLAYVIYTSGSTGKPKGVMVQHQSVVNYTEAASHNFEIQPTDRVLQFASISFDTAMEEIFPCLTRGATLVLRGADMLSSAATFLQKCQELSLTILDLPTAYWHQIASELARGNLTLPKSLRLIIIGGEEALPERLALWQKHTRQPVKLLNTYGPTEATIVATACDLTTLVSDDSMLKEVPIGQAIQNVHAYVLDRHLELCPAGVVGECYIGGAGLARGYLNRPELTAEKFIPNPFSTEGGDRLYRTGDLAWYRVDGQILFRGRVDEQVKIRGFRVELQEIASVLNEHDAVQDAVVVAHEEESGNKALVAYIVTNPNADSIDDVKTGAELPDEQVNQWEQVFDDLYSDLSYHHEAKFYIKGWNSSYTGEPFLDEEVAEWMNQTVERIVSLQPRRVMEIGCGGSGLVLFRVAPLCEEYLATDLSQGSLDVLSRQFRILGQEIPGVVLQQRAADDFQGIGDNSFDAVLITSVVQYFPGIEYLRTVLSQAVDAVRPGGFIFLGDLRSLPFLEAFHASVQLHRAQPTLSIAELKTRILRQAFLEKQLTIDPNFFRALKQHLPKITDVEIKLLRGNHHNELTKFRYDAVLHIGTTPTSDMEIPWLDWDQDQLTTDSIRQMLTENRPQAQGIRGVPNLRVVADLQIMKLLREENGPKTIGELRRAIRNCEQGAVDPEYFWSLGEELSYETNIVYPDAGADGRYTVVFRRKPLDGKLSIPSSSFAEEQVTAKPWHEYANNPTQHVFVSKLIPLLRQYLKQRLPDYMVPSIFMTVDSLPLLPNGKLDRRALPEPEHLRSTEGGGYVEAQTAVEDMLVGIWSEVLGVERVGVNDNFFDLGGHSLLATQITSRVREIFGVEIALRKLFEMPTVAALANNIENAISTGTGLEVPSLVRVSREEELPLSFAQQRLWFIDQLEPGNAFYNVRAAVRLTGALSISALQRTFDEVVRRHEVLRTTFASRAGRLVQVIADAAAVEMPLLDLSAQGEEERERQIRELALAEAGLPFDLGRGPLLRIKLIRLQAEEHVVLLTMHHIVSDAWSIAVLIKEVGALYGAYVRGEQSPLSELGVQYADFAHWQREYLNGAVLEEHIQYWRKQLEGAPAMLELPTDRPRPAALSFRGAVERMELEEELSEQLKALSRQEAVTLFMLSLAAFQLLLSKYSGQQDVVVGTAVANRNRGETEGLIGFFVNMLVLRTELTGNPTFRELLTRVREVCLGAYAHQDLPFEKLVEVLNPDRAISNTPLFQAQFVLQNAPSQRLRLPGLELNSLDGFNAGATAKLDLLLTMTEGKQGISCAMEYSTELFDSNTIVRMLRHFKKLLNSIVAQPDARIDALEYLTEDERQQWSARKKKREESAIRKFNSQKLKPISLSEIEMMD